MISRWAERNPKRKVGRSEKKKSQKKEKKKEERYSSDKRRDWIGIPIGFDFLLLPLPPPFLVGPP